MSGQQLIDIEVVFATENAQRRINVALPQGMTLRSAIERSRILDLCPEIDLTRHRVGIYGRLRNLDDMVNDGDRVEIYLPLLVDPKEARRGRQAKAKQ